MKAQMDTPASSAAQEDLGLLWSLMLSSACDLGMTKEDAYLRFMHIGTTIGDVLLHRPMQADTHAGLARTYISFCEAIIAELKAKLEGRV